MKKGAYRLRPATPQDVKEIAAVYNSNPDFLAAHLGRCAVEEAFLLNELAAMEAAGFLCTVIVDAADETVVGVLDYKEEEPVYLSLLMLHAAQRGNGVGVAVYQAFEQAQRQAGRRGIRIDVVNDEPENLVAFWQKQGFAPQETVRLEWGGKCSQALVMRKQLRAEAAAARP